MTVNNIYETFNNPGNPSYLQFQNTNKELLKRVHHRLYRSGYNVYYENNIINGITNENIFPNTYDTIEDIKNLVNLGLSTNIKEQFLDKYNRTVTLTGHDLGLPLDGLSDDSELLNSGLGILEEIKASFTINIDTNYALVIKERILMPSNCTLNLNCRVHYYTDGDLGLIGEIAVGTQEYRLSQTIDSPAGQSRLYMATNIGPLSNTFSVGQNIKIRGINRGATEVTAQAQDVQIKAVVDSGPDPYLDLESNLEFTFKYEYLENTAYIERFNTTDKSAVLVVLESPLVVDASDGDDRIYVNTNFINDFAIGDTVFIFDPTLIREEITLLSNNPFRLEMCIISDIDSSGLVGFESKINNDYLVSKGSTLRKIAPVRNSVVNGGTVQYILNPSSRNFSVAQMRYCDGCNIQNLTLENKKKRTDIFFNRLTDNKFFYWEVIDQSQQGYTLIGNGADVMIVDLRFNNQRPMLPDKWVDNMLRLYSYDRFLPKQNIKGENIPTLEWDPVNNFFRINKLVELDYGWWDLINLGDKLFSGIEEQTDRTLKSATTYDIKYNAISGRFTFTSDQVIGFRTDFQNGFLCIGLQYSPPELGNAGSSIGINFQIPGFINIVPGINDTLVIEGRAHTLPIQGLQRYAIVGQFLDLFFEFEVGTITLDATNNNFTIKGYSYDHPIGTFSPSTIANNITTFMVRFIPNFLAEYIVPEAGTNSEIYRFKISLFNASFSGTILPQIGFPNSPVATGNQPTFGNRVAQQSSGIGIAYNASANKFIFSGINIFTFIAGNLLPSLGFNSESFEVNINPFESENQLEGVDNQQTLQTNPCNEGYFMFFEDFNDKFFIRHGTAELTHQMPTNILFSYGTFFPYLQDRINLDVSGLAFGPSFDYRITRDDLGYVTIENTLVDRYVPLFPTNTYNLTIDGNSLIIQQGPLVAFEFTGNSLALRIQNFFSAIPGLETMTASYDGNIGQFIITGINGLDVSGNMLTNLGFNSTSFTAVGAIVSDNVVGTGFVNFSLDFEQPENSNFYKILGAFDARGSFPDTIDVSGLTSFTGDSPVFTQCKATGCARIDYSVNSLVDNFKILNGTDRNLCQSGSFYGLALYRSKGCIVSNCQFRNTRHAVLLQSATCNLITDCVAVGTRISSWDLHGLNEKRNVFNNLLDLGSGIHFTPDASTHGSVLFGNSFHMAGCSENIVQNCVAYNYQRNSTANSHRFAVYRPGAVGNILRGCTCFNVQIAFLAQEIKRNDDPTLATNTLIDIKNNVVQDCNFYELERIGDFSIDPDFIMKIKGFEIHNCQFVNFEQGIRLDSTNEDTLANVKDSTLINFRISNNRFVQRDDFTLNSSCNIFELTENIEDFVASNNSFDINCTLAPSTSIRFIRENGTNNELAFLNNTFMGTLVPIVTTTSPLSTFRITYSDKDSWYANSDTSQDATVAAWSSNTTFSGFNNPFGTTPTLLNTLSLVVISNFTVKKPIGRLRIIGVAPYVYAPVTSSDVFILSLFYGANLLTSSYMRMPSSGSGNGNTIRVEAVYEYESTPPLDVQLRISSGVASNIGLIRDPTGGDRDRPTLEIYEID